MRSDDEGQGTSIYSFQQSLSLPEVSRSIIATDELSVPLSIFSTKLSALQALVRYLHEERLLSFTEIATLLQRSPKTIWTTYQQGRKERFPFIAGGLSIPVTIFSSRLLSPLEALVSYLSQLGLKNVEVAHALNLDPRTTWTVAKRAKKKGVSM